MTAGFKIKAVANPKRDIKNRMENDEMKIETLKDRIENAETKISKKQATIQKKLNWIDKKKQALEKYPDKESFEYRMMLCDVENYADDIKRIEKEITETESTLEKYRKQLAGELEKEDASMNSLFRSGTNGTRNAEMICRLIICHCLTENFYQYTATQI